jgi:hypothetical protein
MWSNYVKQFIRTKIEDRFGEFLELWGILLRGMEGLLGDFALHATKKHISFGLRED